jgi:hypothetical protein
MRALAYLLSIGTCLVFVAGCATPPAIAPPEVPAILKAPAGQTLYLSAFATGVQIYECTQRADLAFEWTFRAPEASLASRTGQPLGRHYAGPTWQSVDGSTVVGEVRARDPGPKTSAIPWLLLEVKATTGSGMFSAARSIQRVATVGGIPPAEPCASGNLKQVARVPYSATYNFYR